MKPLISIIIPAFNAEQTLKETLTSVSAQSYRNLEIIVIDDGSTDRTRAIIEDFSRTDARVRWLTKANGGVAAARNSGIDVAGGEFIAPLDADDLWHPCKIELQFERFNSGPTNLGLVYNWYRPVDHESRISGIAAKPMIEGWVLHRHLDWNFVSNGSTPLLRREALANIRYEPGLHHAGNQGCEDYLLQLQVARNWQFGCVPAFLTGYRKVTDGMSANVARMIRSHVQMYRLMQPTLPATGQSVAARRIAEHQIELFRNRIRRGKLVESAAALTEALQSDALASAMKLLEQATLTARFLVGRSPAPSELDGLPFEEADPLRSETPWKPKRRLARLARLGELDRAYGDRVRT